MMQNVCIAALSVQATGDQKDVWVALSSSTEDRIDLFHCGVLGEPRVMRALRPRQGHVAAHGLACADGWLWVVYEPVDTKSGLLVQSLASPSQPPGLPTSGLQPGLPRGKLRSFAVSDHGPWALLRVEQPVAVNTEPDPSENAAVVAGDEVVNTPPEVHAAEAPGEAMWVDRLLTLNPGGWDPVELPAGYPTDSHAWLLVRRPADEFPELLVIPKNTPASQAIVYRRVNNGWESEAYELDPVSATGEQVQPWSWVAIAVDGQLVLGKLIGAGTKASLELSVLRAGKVYPLGTLELQVDTGELVSSSALAVGQTVALMSADAEGGLSWVRMDLQGERVEDDQPLRVPNLQALKVDVDLIALIAVLAISTALMFAFWRRDPVRNRLELPEGLRLAEFGRRAIGGLIDLSPPAVVVMTVFGLKPQELLDHWPGSSGGWEDMLPGLYVVGGYWVHTFIMEMILARSLGKLVLGMRLTTLTGVRPDRWQLALRNVIKPFDIIAWPFPLLILPVIGPYRQRLCDMVARTVVAVPTAEDATDDEKQ